MPPPPPPEDDPSSELNVLRRELRHHQAQLRDAGQQLSAQADDLIHLRRALSAAEADLDDALAREAALRAQLHAQALRRQLVEHTMAAAESLVASLKDMVVEKENGAADIGDAMHPVADSGHAPRALAVRGTAAELDAVLDTIRDAHQPAEAADGEGDDAASVSPLPAEMSAAAAAADPAAMSKLDAVLQTIQEHPASVPNADAEADTAPVSPPSNDPASATLKLDAVLQNIQENPAHAPDADVEGDAAPGLPSPSDPASVSKLDDVLQTIQEHPASTLHADAEGETAPVSPSSSGDPAPETSKADAVLHTLHEQPASAPDPPPTENAPITPALPTAPAAGSPRQVPSGKARGRSRTRQTSNLLLSAFRLGSSGGDGDAVAIRTGVSGESSADTTPLPAEVAAVAKSEGVPARATYQPRRITTCVGDAHAGEIFALAMCDDGEWTVSGGDDRVIRVYGRGGVAHSSITEGVRTVTALAVTGAGADGSATIWCGSSDGSLRSFRPHARRKARWSTGVVLHAHGGAVRRVMRCGEDVLTCGTDRRVAVWDAGTGARTWEARAASAALDADVGPGGMVVSGHKDGAVRLWDRGSAGGLVGGAKVHGKAVTWARALDDGAGVVSLGRDGVLRLLDVRMNVGIVREMQGKVGVGSDWHRAAVQGRLVACGSGRHGVVAVWDVDRGVAVWKGTGEGDAEPDVIDLVARRLRNTGGVLVPVWQPGGAFAAACRTRQVAFWECA